MENLFYQYFDTERMHPERSEEMYRSAFQVDRDRVMHTPAFRGLQSKTQVFWSGEYDFYRTRLTHSLEVSQVGRSICNWLNKSSEALTDEFYIDSDLVEVCCLSHDIGHPPFGHAGEKSLNSLMGEVGGFEGNAQTLRLLTERIFSVSKRGMNPTRACLDGVMKYKTLWSELKAQQGKPPKNHFIYDGQAQYLDWVFGGCDFPIEYTPGAERDGFRSVELQIMDWADDTAYSLNDIADSVRAGFLTIEKIEKWASEQDLNEVQEKVIEKLLASIRRGTVDVMMSQKIGEAISSTSLVERQNFMSTTTNRYRYGVEIEQRAKDEQKVLKNLAVAQVFLSPELNQLECKGDLLLREIWAILTKNYLTGDEPVFRLLPQHLSEEILATDSRQLRYRLICDSVASLTDGSATRLYKRLKVPDFGSIGDLI